MNELTEEPSADTTENGKTELAQKPGALKRMIVNRFGHIRAGWRMIIYTGSALLCIIPVIILLFIIGLVSPDQSGDALASTSSILLNAAMITALILGGLTTLKLIDRRPFGMLGVNFSSGWFIECAIGLGFGFGLLTAVFLTLLLTGLVEVTAGEMNAALWESMARFFILFVAASAVEELLMRGYLFQAFIEGARIWIGVLVFSLIFSLLHFSNPNWSWNGALNIFLAGILLSAAYLKTRSLWLPIGLHTAWNWTQGPLWGMNVSGIAIENSFLVSTPSGPVLLSGGEFGAEGSLISTIFIAGFSWYICKAAWIKPSKVNARLWLRYPPGHGLKPADADGEPS